jgi:hypothetical protein
MVAHVEGVTAVDPYWFSSAALGTADAFLDAHIGKGSTSRRVSRNAGM